MIGAVGMFASEKAALLGDVPTFIVAKALVTPRGGKARLEKKGEMT